MDVLLTERDRAFVYTVAHRIVRNATDAEDVTQDALLLAHRNREAFRGDARYHTWLYRITANVALGYLRWSRRQRASVVGTAREHRLLECVADPVASPDDQLTVAEDRAQFRRAFEQLSPPYRDVLLARESATEAEVARELGISVANVKVRAHRARKQLREALDRIDRNAA